MPIYISMLRGVNVSGKNSIKMEALRKSMLSIGAQNVQTYIQSGNIIFEDDERSAVEWSMLIRQRLLEEFQIDAPVLTLTASDLKKIVESNPHQADEKNESQYMHITFLSEPPALENISKLLKGNYAPEALLLVDKTIYLYCPNGYGKSKLNNNFIERTLRTAATTRNWKTCLELSRMAG